MIDFEPGHPVKLSQTKLVNLALNEHADIETVQEMINALQELKRALFFMDGRAKLDLDWDTFALRLSKEEALLDGGNSLRRIDFTIHGKGKPRGE